MYPFEKLCVICRDYLDNLPTHERDMRQAAVITWCLAYECSDYEALPFYWQRNVGSLLLALRLLRVDLGCKSRDSEVTEVCVKLLEKLWEKHTRKYVAIHSSGGRVVSRLDGQFLYDTLWSIWEVIKA